MINFSRRTLVCASLFSAATCIAYPAPTYENAMAIAEEAHEIVARTGRWEKMPLQDRLEELRKADALVERARRTFGDAPAGPFGACWGTAVFAKEYASNLNSLALILAPGGQIHSRADLFAPPFNAFSFGEFYANCLHQIEALNLAPKKVKNAR